MTKSPPQKKAPAAELELSAEEEVGQTKQSTIATAGKELATVESRLAKMDEIAQDYLERVGSDSGGPFSSTVLLARAMTQLRELMTEDVMKHIMPLMNSPLGFLTDKNPLTKRTNKDGSAVVPYDQFVVRDCVIEASLRGFKIVGNEFNIIGGRFYGAKAGFERMVKSYPGLTNYNDGFDVPRLSEKGSGATLACWAEWYIGTSKQRIERKFPIKGDSYSSGDQYLGKGARKLAAAVYAKLSGKVLPEGEVGEADTPLPPERPQPAAMPVVEAELEVVTSHEAEAEKLGEELEKRGRNHEVFIDGLVTLHAIDRSVLLLEELPGAVIQKCLESLDEVLEAIDKTAA